MQGGEEEVKGGLMAGIHEGRDEPAGLGSRGERIY